MLLCSPFIGRDGPSLDQNSPVFGLDGPVFGRNSPVLGRGSPGVRQLVEHYTGHAVKNPADYADRNGVIFHRHRHRRRRGVVVVAAAAEDGDGDGDGGGDSESVGDSVIICSGSRSCCRRATKLSALKQEGGNRFPKARALMGFTSYQ